jgi:hypothetical protein
MFERLTPKKVAATGLATLAIASSLAAEAKAGDRTTSSKTGIEAVDKAPQQPELVKAQKMFTTMRDALNVVIVIPEHPKGSRNNTYFYQGPDKNGHKLVDGAGVLRDPEYSKPQSYEITFPLYKHSNGEDWIASDITKNHGAISMAHWSPESMSAVVWLRASDLPKGSKVYRLNGVAGEKPIVHGKMAGDWLHFKELPDQLYGGIQIVPEDQTQAISSSATIVPNLEKYIHSD